MNDSADALQSQIDEWIALCKASSESIEAQRYIDEPIEHDLEEFLPIKTIAELPLFQHCMEEHLLTNPENRVLRFAALCPVLVGAFASQSDVSPSKLEYISVFRHLAGLCVPEQLANFSDIKFELYNSYLATNWSLAEGLFLRLLKLGYLSGSEFHLMRGKFWFLSVFGRRIRFEMFNDEYEFYWPVQLPLLDLSDSGEPILKPTNDKERLELRAFLLPERLEQGSISDWILTAWATNPRAARTASHKSGAPNYIDPDSLNGEVTVQIHPGVAEERVREYVSSHYRDFDLLQPQQINEAQRERLINAVADLEQGTGGTSAKHPEYRSLLARSLFELGQFDRADSVFAWLLHHKTEFRNEGTSLFSKEDFEWELWFMRALCQRAMGRPEDAIGILREYLESKSEAGPEDIATGMQHPEGISWWLAKWYAEEGKYLDAADLLRVELQSHFSPQDSWQLSAILALEAVARESTAADLSRKFLESHPDVAATISTVISSYWEGFANLCDLSRRDWLTATWLSSANAPPPLIQSNLLKAAVRDFGSALENELRKRIFEPFREQTLQDPVKVRQVRADSDAEPQMKKFYKYIGGSPKLTMGEMFLAIDRCVQPVLTTDCCFLEFLTLKFPRLTQSRLSLKKALELRNEATHGSTQWTRESTLEMSRNCMKALDAIHEKSTNVASAT